MKKEIYKIIHKIDSMEDDDRGFEETMVLLIEETVRECIAELNEFGEDIENGDILNTSERQLGTDIMHGHLGMILWRASEKLKEKFEL